MVEQIEKELESLIVSQNNNERISEIWNSVCKDDFFLRDSMKVCELRRNYCTTERFFKYPVIIEMVLNNVGSVNKYTYNELSKLILSDIDLARYRYGDKTYLEKLVSNPYLKLNEDEKALCVQEALHVYETKVDYKAKNVYRPLHGNNAFDLKYSILMNKSFEYEEKKLLIPKFYSDDINFYNNFRQWEFNLSNEILGGKYSANSLYNISFEELREYYNSIKIAKRIWNKILLFSYLGNNPPSKVKNEEENNNIMKR